MISAIKKIYSLSPCGTHTKLRTAFQFSLSSPVCKGQTWYLLTNSWIIVLRSFPDSKVHGANMGPTWVLSVPDGPHVGPMNLAIRVAAGSVEDKPGEPTRIKDCLKHKIYIYMFSWTILMLKPKLYTGRTRSLAWLITISSQGWWRHQMETSSAFLAFCEGNSPVTGEFPSQRPVTRGFEVFFDLSLNKRLSKQSRRWRFETPSRPLWRHCNEVLSLQDGTFFRNDRKCENIFYVS